MTYTPEQLDAIQANNPSLHIAEIELKYDLKQVLDSPSLIVFAMGLGRSPAGFGEQQRIRPSRLIDLTGEQI